MMYDFRGYSPIGGTLDTESNDTHVADQIDPAIRIVDYDPKWA